MKNVIDKDLGLKRFKAELEKAKVATVLIGVHQGDMNGGKSIAEYGAYNEFGANIEIAARSQLQYRSIRKNGDFNKKGRFVKKAKSNFASWATIGAYSFKIPERSFMRTTFDEQEGELSKYFSRLYDRLKRGQTTVYDALKNIGLRHSNDIKRTITYRNILPALAPSTVKRKGSSKTLIDSGALRKSIHHVVKMS